jgi:tRNA (guanine26-N2/guanine27-N2)-dimethyltransferase
MKRFKEGSVEFYAPEGDATKKLPVFYNPVMEFDRDLTIAILRAFGGESYCDALAGSGIRGLRAAKEAGFKDLVLNDQSPEAVNLIKKNLKANDISGKAFCEDINLMLRKFKCEKFDVIDIDPFGSSIVALDSALRTINRKKGLLCMTFTDTAPLCGVSIKTCQRRYGARPLRSSYAKEAGLRILIAACVRMAGKYDFSLKPMFCYNRRHYFRLFLRTMNGIEKANKVLDNIGYLQHCFKCDWREYAQIDRFNDNCPVCNNQLNWAGPLWTDKFADDKFEVVSENERVNKLVQMVKKEQGITLPYFDLHHLAELNKTTAPKKRDTLERVNGVQTHFSKTGIRSPEVFNL